MKRYVLLLFTTFLNLAAFSQTVSTKVTPEMFGAAGNGVSDDYTALQAAFASPYEVVLTPNKIYAVSNAITINTNNKIVTGNGAEIKKLNNVKATIIVYHTDKTIISNLRLTLATPINGGDNPAEQPGVDANVHAIITYECTNYKIEDCYIDGSWEMGIGNQNCINGYIHNNTIKNCYRDGTYSQYSVNMTYEGNHYYNIKDDAMSMHDYGIDAQKPEIIAAGYSQAGHSKIINNTVDVAYQGVSSIGCTDIEISGNVIKNTVNAGIAAFTADWEFNGSTATVNHVNIHDNNIYKACTSQTMNGIVFNDYGQLGTGKAALCIISTGANAFYTSATRRLSDISVTNNTVSYSGANAYFLHNIDRLSFSCNQAVNCNRNQSPYTGSISEIFSCNDIIIYNNTITDANDGGIKHISAYTINSSTGFNGKWNITGTINPDPYSITSSTLSAIPIPKIILSN